MRSTSLAIGAAAFAVAVLGAAPAMASTPAAAAPSTPMCATSQLTASVGRPSAGMSQLYYPLVLTNHSSTTCHLTGYPGVSLLDSAGKQIGAPGTRQKHPYQPVVLRSGGSASGTVHTVNHQGTCLPTSAKLRVYPPGNKASLVIPAKITECYNTLDLTPLVAGRGGNPDGSAGPTATAAPSRGTAAPTQGSGQQVTAVPKGAPDTGLAAGTGGGSHGTALAAGAVGVVALGGLGVAARRRTSRARG